MCAIEMGRSIATTMGFTAVDGLPMGTRTGSLDPGVILYLLLHHLYLECRDHYWDHRYDNPAVQFPPTGVYYTYRMRDILRKAKLYKQGRPEQLQAIFAKHWGTVPQLEPTAMQKEILALLRMWQPVPQ